MNYTLITGASSGLGSELASLFAEQGGGLILVARQKDKLQQVASALNARHHTKALIIQQDLSLSNAAEIVFEQVNQWKIPIDTLVNNAGFYVQGPFSATVWQREQELIQLQCINLTKLTKLFLPGMVKRKTGRILNVCSTGSFMPGPFNAIYCAVKGYVLSFSEALAEELSGSGIQVTALCPGGINTSFQDLNKRKQSLINPLMEASVVAQKGYNGFMKGKRVVVPGLSNKIQVFAVRLLPRGIVAWLAGMAGSQSNK